jgi:diguanylate cyclase (GGDEF)-like protein/PAS domain S-box-containing protein
VITKEEIKDKKILELIPEEEHADLLNYLNSFTQDDPVGTYKNSVIITDGTIRTFLWTNHAYFDDTGYISHFTGVGQDITELEHSRIDLYKSEEKFRMIADTSIEVIWQLDPYGRLNYSSPSANIIFGYTSQEIEGLTYNKLLYSEEDVNSADRAFQKALSGKEHQLIELYAIHKDGSIFPIEVSITPIYKDDAIHGVQGIARDISERKEKEKSILDSEKKYRLIAENVTDVIWTTDLYGNFTFVTPSVQRMFGYTSQEANQLSFSDVFPPEEKQLVSQAVQKTLEKDAKNELSRDPGCFELRQIKKDGSLFWTEIMVTPSRNEAGEIVGFQGSTRDIDERKQAEEALHRSENYYRAIFETSGTAMFIINEDATIALANSHFEELSGYARQELEGKKSWTEFIHPEDVTWMKEYHYLRLHDPDAVPRQYECRFINRHGEKRDLLLLVDMIPGTRQSIASSVDLTERKQLEERLRSKEFFLNSVLESVQDGISIIEPDLTICRVNEVVRQWHASNIPLEGKKCYVAYRNAIEPCPSCPTRRCFRSGRKEYEELPGIPGSSAQWIEVYSYPIMDETEKVNYVVEFVRDITQRKQAEQALLESERKYRQEKEYLDNLIHNSPDAVVILDEHGRIVRWNKQAQETSGYSYQDVRGAHFSRFHAEEGQMERMLFELRKKGSIQNCEISLLAKDGREIPCSISISTIHDTENNLIGSINILRDLTEWKKIQQKLEEMSLYDSLTGLYNRNFFEVEMTRLSDTRYSPLGIIVCDLDGLKHINDTLGHQAGDRMLINAADLLRQNFRYSDILARIGGDEFAVLLPQTGRETVERILQRLREAVREYNRIEQQLPLALSMGHAAGDTSEDLQALFREADDMMYREKFSRRGAHATPSCKP